MHILLLALLFSGCTHNQVTPKPEPSATPTVVPIPTPTATSVPIDVPNVFQNLKLLDSWERVEYAKPEEFKTLASVTISKGETVGYVIELVNDAEYPAHMFDRLYKMVPINITDASYIGGKTGTFYDALVPLNQANLVGTKYVYAEFTGKDAGTYLLKLTQAAQTVTLQVKILDRVLEKKAKPFYVAVGNSFVYKGHSKTYVNGAEKLGELYSKMAFDHRISPIQNTAQGLKTVSGELDTKSGAYPFDKFVRPFKTSPMWLPNFTSEESLKAAEKYAQANGPAWFYTWDEPSSAQWETMKALLAAQKLHSPSIKRMVTIRYQKDLDVDIYCPVIDNFDNIPYNGAPKFAGEAEYANHDLWLYTSCMEHGCGCDRKDASCTSRQLHTSTGAAGLSLDRPAAYVYGFITAPLKYKSVKALLYYNSTEQYKLYAKGIDVWTDQYNFGGNGDGTLFYPIRKGMYGFDAELPAPSIRMKLIQKSMQLMDYAALPEAKDCQQNFMQHGRSFEKDAAKYAAYRNCIIERL